MIIKIKWYIKIYILSSESKWSRYAVNETFFHMKMLSLECVGVCKLYALL